MGRRQAIWPIHVKTFCSFNSYFVYVVCYIVHEMQRQIVLFRIAEAMEVNNSICSSKGHIESNSLKRGRTEDKPSCVRDTIVQAYAKTLPSVTRKLALYCAQEKLCLTNWKQGTASADLKNRRTRGRILKCSQCEGSWMKCSVIFVNCYLLQQLQAFHIACNVAAVTTRCICPHGTLIVRYFLHELEYSLKWFRPWDKKAKFLSQNMCKH